MTVHPRSGFEAPIAVLDAINPVLVVLSIIGLFVEFTPLKGYVIPINQVIDLLFVLDFVTRLICFPSGKYFVKGYGWIDFLASLPGIMLLFTYTPVFSAFKFVRIGRFFKIIRILRFLRVFSFLKNMRSDSVWVQERIMKIGISIVLVFVAGIFATDTLSFASLSDLKAAPYQAEYRQGVGLAELTARHTEILFFAADGQVRDREGKLVEPKVFDDALFDPVNLKIEVAFVPEGFTTVEGIRLPMQGVLIEAPDVERAHDSIMLVLISTLVILLFVLMFYVGFVFARDMKVVQLINDSIDADDHLLLNEAARAVATPEGVLELDPEEDEIKSLLKMVGKLTLEREAVESYPTSGQGDLPEAFSSEIARLEQRLDRIESLAEAKDDRMLSQKQLLTIIRETARETLAALRKKD